MPAAYRDDNSFLWTHDDERAQPQNIALELPPPPERRMRPPPAEQSAAPPPETGWQEIALARQTYPEWDHRAQMLRSDWCTVIDKLPSWRSPQPELPHAAAPAVGQELRLRRARRLARAHRLRRQWEGDDLDLNAAIDVMVARRAHMPIDPRLFVRSANEEHGCSVLVLLDLSESTNDRPDPAQPCLLEREKQAALLLARAVAGSADRIAIHGFSSNTRAEVSNYRLLEFGAALDPRAEAMIASAPGRHSTRMGAALRHAVDGLAHEASERRVVLLVTDGAPSDIDVHEPRYLLEDARVAVHEARAAGVQVHCLAVDSGADAYVRRIFGWGHFDIVDDPRALPATLCRLYARLSAA